MFKMVKTGKGLENLLKAVNVLEDTLVEVGHFEDQGKHSTAEKESGVNFSYPELMAYHATGDNALRPPRSPLDVLKIQNRRLSKHSFMKYAVRKAVGSVDNPQQVRKALNLIGEGVGELEKDIFGDPALLAGTANNPDPLIDTGELVDHVAHRNSIEKVIKNVS